MKYYIGCGIFIFTIINNEIHILLGREKNKTKELNFNLYEDLGGGLENNKIEYNAIKELLEESSGSLLLNKKYLTKYYDYQFSNKKLFRGYFIRIDNINPKILRNNYKILKNKKFDGHYLECDKWKFFSLEEIFNAKQVTKKGYYTDTEEYIKIGNNYIAERTWKILLKGKDKYMKHIYHNFLDINHCEKVKLPVFKNINIKTFYLKKK